MMSSARFSFGLTYERLTEYCFHRDIRRVQLLLEEHPELKLTIQTGVMAVRWIHLKKPGKTILRYLYQECGMKLVSIRDTNRVTKSQVPEVNQELIQIGVLVMSAPILELKDFVQYLSQMLKWT